MGCMTGVGERMNVSFIVAHHRRKGTATAGDFDQARGAIAVRDVARIALTMTTMTAEEAGAFNLSEATRHQFFRIDDAKQQFAPLDGNAEWFERTPRDIANRETASS